MPFFYPLLRYAPTLFRPPAPPCTPPPRRLPRKTRQSIVNGRIFISLLHYNTAPSASHAALPPPPTRQPSYLKPREQLPANAPINRPQVSVTLFHRPLALFPSSGFLFHPLPLPCRVRFPRQPESLQNQPKMPLSPNLSQFFLTPCRSKTSASFFLVRRCIPARHQKKRTADFAVDRFLLLNCFPKFTR